jgi:chromosome partitioning protein
VLVDLDWDAGGATRMWGFDPARAVRAPLLDALERGPEGRPPRPRRRPNQPELVPAHPDLSASRIDADLVADCLGAWASQWGRPYVVVDTHPGANPLTDGAMQIADLVVVPVARRALDGRPGGDRRRLRGLPAAARPTMVPPVPPRRFVDRLAGLLNGRIAVAPPFSEHRWIRRRLRRAALVTQPNPGARVRAAAAELSAVVEAVEEACG